MARADYWKVSLSPSVWREEVIGSWFVAADEKLVPKSCDSLGWIVAQDIVEVSAVIFDFYRQKLK